MTALTADLVLDERLLNDLKVHSRTSPLWLWLARHYDQLLAIGRIGRWRSLCEAATSAGLRNTKGGELTPAIISRVWSRLKQARRRAAGEQRPALSVQVVEHRQVAASEPARAGHAYQPPPALDPVPQRQPDSAPQGHATPMPVAGRVPAPPSMRPADPPRRSLEEVRAIKRLTLGMMDVGFKKSNSFYREARQQQAALIEEAKALGLEHELPPLVFEDDD